MSASLEAAFISIKNSSVVVAVMGTQSTKALYHKEMQVSTCWRRFASGENLRRDMLQHIPYKDVASGLCTRRSSSRLMRRSDATGVSFINHVACQLVWHVGFNRGSKLPRCSFVASAHYNDSVAHLRIFQNNITKNC